jgi:hypothetical protein
VTLVIGYVLKVVSDLLQSRWTANKEREAREAVRLEKRYERRTAFQREALLSLQEAIQALGRATGQANHHDEMAFRESGSWRKSLLPSDVDQKLFESQTQAAMFSVRVRDEQIRELVIQYKTESVGVTFANDREDASKHLAMMMALGDSLHSRIGEIIRRIDDDNDS